MTTSTEPITLSAKEIRLSWISEMSNAVRPGMPPVMFRALLALVRTEGPGLASPSNQWWARRLRWIELKLEQGFDPEFILVQALWDMHFANENDGR